MTDTAATPAPENESQAAPTPKPVPKPSALRPAPKPPVAPVVPAAPAPEAISEADASWGKVDDDGTVSVREGEEWRVVGQYPDGTPQEALTYYVRKFQDLALRVGNLELRHQQGGASASELTSQAKHLLDEVTGAAAVGDLAGLQGRLESLTTDLAQASEAEAQAQREATDAAIAERTTIVERIEAIANGDLSKVQWKQTTAEVSSLFEQWQEHQKSSARVPRSVSQQLWKRFRDARGSIDKARRAFYANLDDEHKGARDRKQQLIDRAEALAPRGSDGIPAYRDLLDEWKRSGRAGRKADDALWARFKAAGDALYAARAEQAAADEADSRPKIAAREALLEEAAGLASIDDVKKARQKLTDIQDRWDATGRIFPRDRERGLDDRLRKFEQDLKAREDAAWKASNPETKARAGSLAEQLRDAIAKLEEELAAAQAAGNKQAMADAQEALDARQAWLRALGE